MAANKNGTNFFTPNGDTGVETALTDSTGLAKLVSCATADIPSGVSGYAKGCILQNITTGSMLLNTGTSTSCTFTVVSATNF